MNEKITKEEIKKDLKNKKALIPNILSASRIPAPIVILGFTFSSNPLGAILSAGAFAITDLFDGKIARKLNAETKLGELLDAISDKVFSLGIMLPLIPTNPLLLLTTGLEATIAGINANCLKKGGHPVSLLQGKVKSTILSSTLLLECLAIASNSSLLFTITNAILASTAALQVSNIVAYNKAAKESIKSNQITKTDSNKTEDNTNIFKQTKSKSLQQEKEDLLELKKELLAEEIYQNEKGKIKVKKMELN